MDLQKIMIVDDSATSRMIIKRCFQMAGYQDSTFLEAEDGLKAMSELNKTKVDIVVTDLNMPKMDGATFIKKLRLMDKTKELPVLVISSMGSDAMEKELTNSKVLGIIRKPMTPEKVVEVLGEG
ncbi:MAG TPA: response regulator [Sediminispirochaeta sp.]|nr:response regulator [Sediminispirochaeta sp.]